MTVCQELFRTSVQLVQNQTAVFACTHSLEQRPRLLSLLLVILSLNLRKMYGDLGETSLFSRHFVYAFWAFFRIFVILSMHFDPLVHVF